MMETQLKISIIGTSTAESKQVQVLNPKLSPIASAWISGRSWTIDLPKGIYTVRLNMATGERYEQIAVADRRKVVRVHFDLREGGPKKRRPRVQAEKASTPEERLITKIFGEERAIRDYQFASQIGRPAMRLWTREAQEWISRILPQQFVNMMAEKGATVTFSPTVHRTFLELEYPQAPSKYVSLPPRQVISCTISTIENPVTGHNEFDVSVKMYNANAQALLSLLHSGDLARARSLWALENAEALLYQKIEDPIAAAIGGYYLLKTGELSRLHDWANNLANWFDWLADGCVIHAWQMILQNKNNEQGQQYQKAIRSRLLESIDRGLPVFTEGIRLLFEGLAMCSYQFDGKDEQVEAALKSVKDMVASSDMTKETSTYTRDYNDLPVKGHPGGTPMPPSIISESMISYQEYASVMPQSTKKLYI